MRDFRAWSLSMNPNGTALESVNMRTLEHRRLEQALVMSFKSLKLNSPSYISDFFTPQTTPYNLRIANLRLINYHIGQNIYIIHLAVLCPICGTISL